MELDLPHAREQDARIARVHRDLRTPGVLVDEQRALPGRAAVDGAEHAALLLRTVGRAERAREDDLRIHRVDDDAAEPAGLLEPAVGPRLARVSGLVDAA